ncbi:MULTISPECIES: hypothetical protein [unclassified Aureimonas]|uniref:hypothetical protein n=1 Tax=unclassified Aureimonas TaxID=2615206 RepID=UPI0006FB50CF|nr:MULTISPECIES: hypothetical protein [unclassified Aureimonas]KQT52235.1 hypothetical protein ASG62_16385 [Aureimonas sp. Leaf427]KQT70531.1 hypothetical protein ASG54_21565 [Aureimonas sp. Leaf460]
MEKDRTGPVVGKLRQRVQALEEKPADQTSIATEARTRADADIALADSIGAETRARTDADTSEAGARSAADKANGDAISAEVKARGDAITAEASARVAGDKTNADALTAEAKSRSDADASEAKARGDADAAMQARIVTLTGALVLPAGLSIAVGKTERKVVVPGLKKGDVVAITPDKALPGGMSLGDAYCLVDGELTLATLFTALLGLSLSAATTITLSIKAIR